MLADEPIEQEPKPKPKHTVFHIEPDERQWNNLDQGLGCLCVCIGIAIIIAAIGFAS